MQSPALLPLLLSLLLVCLAFPSPASSAVYNLSTAAGLGYRFDGIGALSGGGCTSRLLVDYPEPSRTRILDYLFTPGFGASLQILKVEIGGDAQSTEGTEPSHMHTADEENYERGYQWWLMREAKRRNPSILLSALSWGFPQWVSEGTHLPFTNSTVRYIMNYLQAARTQHNLTIDFIGIWNERGYTAQYILSLSAALRKSGLPTRLVAHDESGPNNWDICAPLAANPALLDAVDIIGAHYPGSTSDAVCSELGKPLWSSEDYAEDWHRGGGCMARILNQNLVRGNMTATIAWNLAASYYDELAYTADGLLHAVTPWDGHYDIGHSLWAVAHTTHFTAPGWHYLRRGAGVGYLEGGGSYVSLTDGRQLTVVIELMPPESTQCHWGTSPSYIVTAQTATFALDASLSHVTSLYLFTTNISTAADAADDFHAHGAVAVTDGAVTLQLHPYMLYTLSTVNSSRGSHPTPPPATPFPFPYADDFDRHALDSEAPYFFDQAGSWQITPANATTGRVMRQAVLQPPVPWCTENPVPYSVVGSHAWLDVNVTVRVLMEEGGGGEGGEGEGFVAARVEGGGCVGAGGSGGTAFGISTAGWWAVCNSTAFARTCRDVGKVDVQAGRWYTLTLVVEGARVEGFIDGRSVVNTTSARGQQSGWAGIGSSWTHVQFDDFSVAASSRSLPAVEAAQQAVRLRVEAA